MISARSIFAALPCLLWAAVAQAQSLGPSDCPAGTKLHEALWEDDASPLPPGVGWNKRTAATRISAIDEQSCVKRGSGKRHGPFQRYDEAGNLVLTGAYKNDLAHGTWSVFHTDGTRLGQYRMNRGTGIVMEYFEDKTPRSSTAYRRGRKHGAYKEWTREKVKSGRFRHKLFLTGRYKNDRKDGRWRYHAPGGITEVYVRGKRTKVITCDGEVHQGAGILGRFSMAKNKPFGPGDGLTGLTGSLQGSVVSPCEAQGDGGGRRKESAGADPRAQGASHGPSRPGPGGGRVGHDCSGRAGP
jgi:hypothetical protein